MKWKMMTGAAISLLLLELATTGSLLAAPITLTSTQTSSASNFLYGTTGYYASRLGAQRKAFDDLNKQAKKSCPNGYRIISGPFESTTTTSSWSGGWLIYTSTCSASVVIECDDALADKPDDEKYPLISPKDAVPFPPLDSKEEKKRLEQHRSELLKAKNADDIVKLVEKYNVSGVDYSPFYQAVRNHEVTRINVPTVEEFIESCLDDLPEQVSKESRR